MTAAVLGPNCIVESQPFDKESEMAMPFLGGLDEGSFVVVELPLEHGRPDLLTFKFCLSTASQRAAHTGAMHLSRAALKILSQVREEPLRIDSLGANYCISVEATRRHLSCLRRFGLVEYDREWVRLVADYHPPFQSIHAFDLKRTDWQRAVAQARNHVAFADYTSIVIDAAYAHRVNQNILREYGLGLFALARSGISNCLHSPRQHVPNRALLRRTVIERVWRMMNERNAAMLTGDPTAALSHYT